MKPRTINVLLAAVVLAALVVNSAARNSGWALVGEIIGWVLIVGILFAVIDNKIKEMQQ